MKSSAGRDPSPAAEVIDHLRSAFEGGDRKALIQAICYCAGRGLVMPGWVVKELLGGWDAVHSYRAKSWDEVFGRPHKKSVSLPVQRRRLEMLIPVYREVTELREAQPERHPLDAFTFAEVGKKLKISEGMARKLYYEAKKIFGPRPKQ